jgi:hypothetical protein
VVSDGRGAKVDGSVALAMMIFRRYDFNLHHVADRFSKLK